MKLGSVQRSIPERLAHYSVPVTETGCWLWTAAGSAGRGYGYLRVGGRNMYAHRLAYAEENGPIPAGLCVCHKCDTPSCINPTHMFLGSIADNNADRARKGRGADKRGERQSNAKLTAARIIAIRSDTRLQSVIAAEAGVSFQLICDIKRGKRWKHL